MAGDINIVAIVKGEERYVFMFDDDSRAETLRTLGRFASNPELSFSWYDAAVLSQKIRKVPAANSCPPDGEELTSHPVVRRARRERDAAPPLPDIELPASDDLWIGDEPVA